MYLFLIALEIGTNSMNIILLHGDGNRSAIAPQEQRVCHAFRDESPKRTWTSRTLSTREHVGIAPAATDAWLLLLCGGGAC